MDQIPCPDGYLLDARSPIANGHHALNDYLVRVEEAGWKIALKEVNGIKDKRLKLAIWKALVERMLWLRDNRSTSDCLSPLRGLAERIEKWTLAPSESDLIEILGPTADAALFLAPYTPIPHLFAHIDAHGLTPEMAAAIRRFRARVYDERLAVNQTSLQLFRSRLDMLAWRDEWTPADLKRCWSERIRADFRAMKGKERDDWRSLLYSIHGDEGTRPAPKWSAAAELAIQAIGCDAFYERLSAWLSPLAKGTSHRLSREGSFLLRCFIWLAQKSDDPALTARVAGIAQVEFKPKANGEKVLRAAAEAAGLPGPNVPASTAPPKFEELASRALSAVAPSLGARVDVGREIVYVRGSLDTYELHIAGGAIYRQSDGRRIQVQSPLPPALPIPLHAGGGVIELVKNILILADDANNANALKLC